MEEKIKEMEDERGYDKGERKEGREVVRRRM